MDSSTLARQTYEKQLKLGLPGLAKEVRTICETLNIPDVNLSNISKKKIDEYIFYNDYKDMNEAISNSKKMEKIKHEDFRQEQDYLNSKSVDSSRTQLRIRLEMLDSFKDNYCCKYRTLDRGQEDMDPGLQCGDCGQDRDSQSHCLVCPAWAEARDRLDLSCIGDMVLYYQRVLKGRDEKEKKRKKRRRIVAWSANRLQCTEC